MVFRWCPERVEKAAGLDREWLGRKGDLGETKTSRRRFQVPPATAPRPSGPHRDHQRADPSPERPVPGRPAPCKPRPRQVRLPPPHLQTLKKERRMARFTFLRTVQTDHASATPAVRALRGRAGSWLHSTTLNSNSHAVSSLTLPRLRCSEARQRKPLSASLSQTERPRLWRPLRLQSGRWSSQSWHNRCPGPASDFLETLRLVVLNPNKSPGPFSQPAVWALLETMPPGRSVCVAEPPGLLRCVSLWSEVAGVAGAVGWHLEGTERHSLMPVLSWIVREPLRGWGGVGGPGHREAETRPFPHFWEWVWDGKRRVQLLLQWASPDLTYALASCLSNSARWPEAGG